jgi:hypothetical protein
MLIALVILAIVAVLVIPELPVGTPRIAGWVSIVVVALASVWALRPRARRR